MRVLATSPISLAFLIAATLSGCAPEQPPSTQPPRRVSAPVGSGSVTQETIGDTDEMIWPDPAERTRVRMGALQNLLARYVSEHGDLPSTLDAVAPVGTPEAARVRVDGWGRPLRYFLLGSRYRLQSLGPDDVSGTADDISVNGDKGTRPS